MRIATQTIYDDQTAAIDQLVVNQQNFGQQASSGRSLNMPSDNPTQIAQDLSVGTTLGTEGQIVKNVVNSQNELAAVDGALNSVTNILQKARQLTIEAASDAMTAQQRASIADEVTGLLQTMIGQANATYNGVYVFSGTVAPSTPPVKASGTPISSVTFTGNEQNTSQIVVNGQTIQLSTTLQKAFNFNSTDGSFDAFQTLINLRNTLTSNAAADTSSSGVNVNGTVINGGTLLTSANFSTPIVADSLGNVSLEIGGYLGSQQVTFALAGSTVNSMLAAINAQTPSTGVSAAFNAQTEKITFTSANGTPFNVSDVPSAGAVGTSNIVQAFNITQQADVVGELSRQLGDIDTVLNRALDARAVIGGNIQTLAGVQSQTSSLVVNNTSVQSSIEDADIAKVVSQFSQTQTALQAAYATTNRLESKVLFDYLT